VEKKGNGRAMLGVAPMVPTVIARSGRGARSGNGIREWSAADSRGASLELRAMDESESGKMASSWSGSSSGEQDPLEGHG